MVGECRWSREGAPVGIFSGKYEWAGEVGGGDCSLLVMDADVEFDSGVWQCAVTASSFRSKDALVSAVGQLVVREGPSDIFIRHVEHDDRTEIVGDNDTISVVENANITLECISVGGIPPPRLSWNYTDSVKTVDLTQDSDDPAVSVLVAVVRRSVGQVQVRCSADHDALEDKMETAVNISVECK